MPKVNLSLDTLKDLDSGRAAVAINAALNRALSDLDDRGADKKERRVTIEIAMGKSGKHGDSNDVYVDVRVNCKVPSYYTNSTMCKLGVNNKGRAEAWFQPDSPENPDQKSIDWAGGEVPNDQPPTE